jgi:hypothetical protein
MVRRDLMAPAIRPEADGAPEANPGKLATA